MTGNTAESGPENAMAPSIGTDAFEARRERLMEQFGEGAAAVFVGTSEALRNGDVDHEFRQTSTFHYLTGFDEPNAICLLRPGEAEPYVLFVQPGDSNQELWLGPRAGVDEAVSKFGADAALPNDDLEEALPELLEGVTTLYYSLVPSGSLRGFAHRVQDSLLKVITHSRGAAVRGSQGIDRVIDPFPIVSDLRLRKEPAELVALRRAVDVTGSGIERAMRIARSGLYEYEVQAELEAEYRRLGSPRNGFPSIVATGANACTLHYVSNRALISEGDLLLIDTGAEIGYYGADVTRTFPVDGRFSVPQRAIYELVLAAQRAGIAAIAPGVRFHAVHDAAVHVLTTGLMELGMLSGDFNKLTDSDVLRAYYPHSTSHWLGLDVHDVGRYRFGEESVELEPGMVLTVEPGLYIRPDAEAAPVEYRGIGVRIEDDVLVTETGYEVLSASIPSDPDELERIVSKD